MTRIGDPQREAETDGAGAAVPGRSFGRGAAIAPFDDIGTPEWRPMRELLEDLSRDRAVQGYSPSETAIFVFSLKEPLFALLREELACRRRPARAARPGSPAV